MSIDLGDTVPLAVQIRDTTGAAADAGAVTCTVTTPDGVSVAVPVARTATGLYTAAFETTQSGPHGVRWVATGANASAYSDGFTVLTPSVPLVSLADLKTHLNISDADDDGELRATLAAAHDAIEANLRRPVTRTTRTDVLTPRGNGRSVVLPMPDVAAIVSVTDNGTPVSPDDYTADLRTGTLTRSFGWTGPVAVEWTTRPVDTADVRQAVLEMTRHLWETQRGSVKSLPRASGDSAPTAGYSLPNRVSELLDPHRTRA